MRSILSGAIVLAIALLLWPCLRLDAGSVRAGTAVRLDVPGLVQRADLILEARVLAAHSLDNLGRIETEYLLEVERTFEGEEQAYRLVHLPGGVLPDGRALVLSGMPAMRAGERMILFLSQEGAGGVRMPVGLAQGKFEVVRREDGTKALLQDTTGVRLVGRNHRDAGIGGPSFQSYARVVAQIEAALAKKHAEER